MSRTIGVTGPRGFIASHVIRRLENEPGVTVVTADRGDFDSETGLAEFVQQCDVILHLAAMNRGEADHVYGANKWLTEQLTKASPTLKFGHTSSLPPRPNVIATVPTDARSVKASWN